MDNLHRPVVVQVTDSLKFSGSERLMVDIAVGLDRNTFDSRVLSLTSEGILISELEAARIPVACLDKRRGVDLSIIWKIARVLRQWTPQIVHTYRTTANMWGRLAALAVGVPVIVASEHNREHKGKGRITIDRLLAKRTAKIVTVSGDIESQLVNEYSINAQRVLRIEEGIDFSQFHPRPKDLEFRRKLTGGTDGQLIGIIARLMEQKGHRFFLEALQRVVNVVPDVRALIIGEGVLRLELEVYSRTLGLDPFVRFVGFRNDLPELLPQLDLFVMSSLWEGLPVAMLDAAASGTPIVTTDVGGIPEFIRDQENGWLVPAGNAEALAEAIIDALRHPARAKAMAERAQSDVLARYGLRQMIQAHEALYFELLNRLNSC